MKTTQADRCSDIVNCLLDDYASLRQHLSILRAREFDKKSGREMLKQFFILLEAHTQAEEEVVLARALEVEQSRLDAVEALEEHEVTDFQVARVKQSADEATRLAHG